MLIELVCVALYHYILWVIQPMSFLINLEIRLILFSLDSLLSFHQAFVNILPIV
jgi:hypothetical protein